MSAIHIRITGRVQGVGYREWMRHTATALGLRGWVRNRADGSVEAVAAGDEAAMRQLEAYCRQGPPLARVEEIVVQPVEAPETAAFEKFPSL